MRYGSLIAPAIVALITFPAASIAQPVNDAHSFVTMAAISDMYEIQAGQLAAGKATSAATRDFGTQMVQAHTKTSENLKAAVRKSGLPIAPPTDLDPPHQKMVDALNNTKGAAFEQLYISQQLQAHQQALSLMQGYASSGDTPALREVAAKTVPVIQEHLQMLKMLR